MVLTDEWFSGMAENDNGDMVFVMGRDGVDEFRRSGKFKHRVEIYWHYDADDKGLPCETDAELMERVTGALRTVVEKDKLAIMTGVYTGSGERTMVFYARTAVVFGERLNEALRDFPVLPIEIYVENDIEWNEYQEMEEIRPWAE